MLVHVDAMSSLADQERNALGFWPRVALIEAINAQCYEPEEGSFAELLNQLIAEIAGCDPPARYHDNEDRLAEYVVRSLGWSIRKEKGRWIGEDYDVILQQGGFDDLDEQELIKASAGRVRAALKRGQYHFDDMERSHQRMLAAILTTILYHRANKLEL